MLWYWLEVLELIYSLYWKIFCLTKVASMLHNCFPCQRLEPVVHGRGRKTDNMDETYLGVYEELLYARKLQPAEGTFSDLKCEDSCFLGLCYFFILLSLMLYQFWGSLSAVYFTCIKLSSSQSWNSIIKQLFLASKFEVIFSNDI